ncbi:hypothetical protein ACFODZ_11600 [Marinicella sediminis]|uniref:Uncharacterized protein n=1 Tax=Marinicella sediminis TaxID=1792834 RepID=A0ABV7J9U4_9GAMM|nr:hypothetical protein [Marinicella sediminis]
MLYEAMKKEIEDKFPSLQFSADDGKKLISIPPAYEQVGSIDIQDDYDELTIFVGNFTHWHCGYINEKSDDIEEVKEIVSEVAEYLQDMFNDKIFMWGSAMKGGGTQLIEGDFKTKREGYVWSGPYHS